MALEKPTDEKLNEVLDLIHDIAVKAAGEDGIPAKVDEALDRIIALARYKMDVTNSKKR